MVTGDVSLSGSLVVNVLPPFPLTAGKSWEIVDVEGSLSGGFTGLAEGGFVGSFDGVDLYISYEGGDGNDVLLTAGLAGDFDGDGAVDAADYVVWRNGLGTTYDEADYDAWRAHFGDTASSGAGARVSENVSAVPEPTSALLLLIGLAAMCFRRRPVAS